MSQLGLVLLLSTFLLGGVVSFLSHYLLATKFNFVAKIVHKRILNIKFCHLVPTQIIC